MRKFAITVSTLAIAAATLGSLGCKGRTDTIDNNNNVQPSGQGGGPQTPMGDDYRNPSGNAGTESIDNTKGPATSHGESTGGLGSDHESTGHEGTSGGMGGGPGSHGSDMGSSGAGSDFGAGGLGGSVGSNPDMAGGKDGGISGGISGGKDGGVSGGKDVGSKSSGEY